MKAIRRFLGIAALGMIAAAPLQGQSWYVLSFQPAQPLSNTQDFTSNFAWRGIGLDYKTQIKPNLAVGANFGWQVFDEQTDEVVSAFGVDLSGDQFRYVNSWPMLANITSCSALPEGFVRTSLPTSARTLCSTAWTSASTPSARPTCISDSAPRPASVYRWDRPWRPS